MFSEPHPQAQKQFFIKGEDDPDPRAFNQKAVREGLEQCELCVSSDSTAFLNLPLKKPLSWTAVCTTRLC